MQTVSQIVQQINEGHAGLQFLPTGFKELDEHLDGGFLRKELIVLGGFTGIGKSYVSGQILFNITQAGFKCGYFSLEISNSMVLSRLIGQEADIRSTKIMTGRLTTEEQARKSYALGRILQHEDKMSFYDEVYEYAELEKQIRQNKFDFVIIDFIQNVMIPGMDEYPRLSHISLKLQKLAKELDCCILVLSQLSNAIARNVEEANLEYKGSGSIATVCDLGFIILRDYQLGVTELLLRKNRRGASGIKIQLQFVGEGGKLV